KSVLFFGREMELTRLSGEQNHGGSIIGAHHSGKTTLLHKLKEELSSHRRLVIGPLSSTTRDDFLEVAKKALEALPQGRGAGITHMLGQDGHLTIDNFERTLRRLSEQLGPISILIDEIDTLLKADEAEGTRLARIMQSLTLGAEADFYLAGH